MRRKAPGAPTNGRAMTRPMRWRSAITRAASQIRYSSSSGTVSSCAAICRTESADVYRMRSPVAMCSAPSSSMIAVPDAALLPSRPRPAAARSGCVIAGGKPSGNVAIACLVTSPAISQWPVIVSLPADASRITPQAARGAAASRTPAIAVRLPRPIACRLGSHRPPAARAMLPSVSAPASPYSAASGAAAATDPVGDDDDARVKTSHRAQSALSGDVFAIVATGVPGRR